MNTLLKDASGVGNDNCGNHDVKQPSDIEKQHKRVVIGVETLNKLGSTLHITLQVKEHNLGVGSNVPSQDAGSSSTEEENLAAGDCDINFDGFSSTLSNPLQKCPIFHDECFSVGKRSLRHAASTGKLVSAMKGSREREGTTHKKTRVSWAPDVYDPPPSSVSHRPKKKALTRQQIKSNKKHGKGKPKGKSTRRGGSGSKGKNRYCKVSGRSDWSLDSYTVTDEDDNLQRDDSSCGGGYLGKNRSAMQFAYAEATK